MIEALKPSLEARKKAGNFRALQVFDGVDFCSNDYLGLGRNPLNTEKQASGSTGSRLISGHDEALNTLEQNIASFHGFESALLFSSGYSANTGLLACIAGKDDVILSDDLIHASLIDGIRLSYAKRERFAHNDLKDLEVQLEKNCGAIKGQIYVAVESIYSMDGDHAPLAKISELCQRYNAALIVDEAHAIGVYGEQGRGLVSQLGLNDHVFAAIYTFGKAVGMHGAVITGSSVLRDYLINFCRPFIYTTAPSPQTIADTHAVYKRFQSAETKRRALQTVLQYFETQVKNIPLKNAHWLDSQSPIQGLIVPGNNRAKSLALFLQDNEIAVKAILSPTVAEGAERLRISLHSFNTTDDMDKLRTCLSAFLNDEKP